MFTLICYHTFPSFSILTPSLIPPRHPPYFIPLSPLPLHHLFTILPPSLYIPSFLALFLIPVSCAFKHLANLRVFLTCTKEDRFITQKCFPILSSYLLIRSHSMFMLALVITIIIVDTLFRPHLTIMSSTIYMNISVHKKNPIKKGEGKN